MTSKVRAILVVAIALVFLLPICSTGQEKQDYIIVKGGVYSPTGGLDDLNFDSGFNGEAAWGHYFLPNFVALEAGTGFFESDDVRVVPLVVTGKVIYPTGNWELFSELGVGAYFAKFKGTFTSASLGNITVSDDDVVYGLSLGFGANYNITQEFFLGIEGKYLLTTDAEFDGAATGGQVKLETDMNGYTVTAVFGFRF